MCNESEGTEPTDADWQLLLDERDRVLPMADVDWGERIGWLKTDYQYSDWWATIPFGMDPNQPILKLSPASTVVRIVKALRNDQEPDPAALLHLLVMLSPDS